MRLGYWKPAWRLIFENDVPDEVLAAITRMACAGLIVYLQRVNYAGNITQDGEEDVDEEVGVATALEENTKWW